MALLNLSIYCKRNNETGKNTEFQQNQELIGGLGGNRYIQRLKRLELHTRILVNRLPLEFENDMSAELYVGQGEHSSTLWQARPRNVANTLTVHVNEPLLSLFLFIDLNTNVPRHKVH